MTTRAAVIATVLALLPIVGCGSPKPAGTVPADGNYGRVWDLTLHPSAGKGSVSWVEVRAADPNDKSGYGARTLQDPEGRTRFDGTWIDSKQTASTPFYSFWEAQLSLDPSGQAEYLEEVGSAVEGDPKAGQRKVVSRWVGKWQKTGVDTATVWLRPAQQSP